MRIIVDLPKGKLSIYDLKVFPISCQVRTLKDGTRKSSEVVRTLPNNLPYDPAPFPSGRWHVTEVEWQKDKAGKKVFDYNTYGPVKIRTDAYQWAKVWQLDKEGDYLRERGDEVKDHGYLLHYSASSTTLGCIRMASPEDAEALAKTIEMVLKSGETVGLEVISKT